MNTSALSLNDIRKTGIDILTEKLGAAGMIRFLQQSETGSGDYTQEKENILGDPTPDELFNEIKNIKKA
ncbi:MAG: hypothetical protein QM504_13755 [Pseudomonadota bacterium]